MTLDEFGAIEKPSELLTLALNDLEAVEQDSRYRVDMGHWHRPLPSEGYCAVCLAGAVLANSLGVAINEVMTPKYLEHVEAAKRLLALDDLRNGYIELGLDQMGISHCPLPETIEIPPYRNDSGEFITAILDLIETLKAAGL
jgi:hypothetical protein